MAISRYVAVFLTATFITLGSLGGEANGGMINDPFRYFQHQKPGGPTSSPFLGVCYSAAGYNMMLGMVSANHGTWKVGAAGGTEAYGTLIAGGYDGVDSHNEFTDMDLTNEHTAWDTVNENFVTTYLSAPTGFSYKTVDYAFADLGKIDLKNAIGALGLVDRVDIANAALLAGEWWANFHVVSIYDLDILGKTAKFTDSNIDKAGKEYTGNAGASERQDFTYGILSGGGQTLSWTAAGIISNADGTNMDDELLESIRVVYLQAVPEPSSIALAGFGVFGLVIGSYRKRQLSA